jgi:ketosteroid isomerase-like protein
MGELQEFLDTFVPRQRAAERVIHDGDPGPRLALWTETDPATLLGAALPCVSGAADVRAAFAQVASWFSNCTAYDFEVVAAGVSGDLAYTVGFEHTTAEVEGDRRTYTLRATHVYRREDGEWRIVHRHADAPPVPPAAGELDGVLQPQSDFADFADCVDRTREALRRFVAGDPEPMLARFSERAEVTLLNPLHPVARGRAQVEAATRAACANFGAGGQMTDVRVDFEEVSRVETGETAHLVQLERGQARMAGHEGPVSFALRVTMVFHREDGEWRIVHRHADPITTPRGVETMLQQ